MKKGTFEKEIFIQSDTLAVINVITDYSQYPKIYPLIIKVERAKDDPAGVKRYFITDSLKWGPFKFKVKYRTDIISVTEDTVHTEVYQSPGIFVTHITKVIPQGTGVRLHETIIVKAPDMLFHYTLQRVRNVHEEMLKHIKAFVESDKL